MHKLSLENPSFVLQQQERASVYVGLQLQLVLLSTTALGLALEFSRGAVGYLGK